MSSRTSPTTPTRPGAASYFVLVVFVGLAALVNVVWPFPLWLIGLYLGASILCFVVYAVDKSAARAGRRRTPEKTLLILGLIGGWPGAIVAQQVLRHKTQKVSFRRGFWVTVVVNIIVVTILATPVLPLLFNA